MRIKENLEEGAFWGQYACMGCTALGDTLDEVAEECACDRPQAVLPANVLLAFVNRIEKEEADAADQEGD